MLYGLFELSNTAKILMDGSSFHVGKLCSSQSKSELLMEGGASQFKFLHNQVCLELGYPFCLFIAEKLVW